MPAKEHVHTYIRAIGRVTKANQDSKMIGYYKCADPDCSHYIKAELALGKKSLCNRCGKEFILPIALRLMVNKPHCKACTRKVEPIETRSEAAVNAMEEYLDLVETNGD